MDLNIADFTLNEFIFVMEIFYTSPGKKFGIIGIKHEASSY